MLLSLSSCTVYQTVPSYPTAFDRSWSAALGAVEDAGVNITTADRGSGVISGTRGASDVTVTVLSQADGGARVEITARRPAGQDRDLAQSISNAYDRRMGR